MPHEAATCRIYILSKLKSAGREDHYVIEQLFLTPDLLDKAFQGEL
jgi:hypothetical protein